MDAQVIPMPVALGKLVDRDTQYEIEQGYYREAWLLDREQFRAWLTMLTADIFYWMPIRENRYRKDKRPELTEDTPGIYEDTFRDLEERIARLESGMVWMEDPATRIRRLISNVIAEYGEKENEYHVYSNFIVYRNRRLRDESWHVGTREDILRRESGELKIARRTVFLDQRVVLDKNIYIFI